MSTKIFKIATEQDDYTDWSISFTDGKAKIAPRSNPDYCIVGGQSFGLYQNTNVSIFQKVGGGSGEPDVPAIPEYTLNLKSVEYVFDTRMANLTLFESETSSEGNYINLGLMNPAQTDNRLVAGEYPLFTEDYAGGTPAMMGGRIEYNIKEYEVIPAENNSLVLSYNNSAKPNELTVTFTLTAMNEDGETAIFKGEWTGAMNYGSEAYTLDLAGAASSYYYQNGGDNLTLTAPNGQKVVLTLYNAEQTNKRLVAGEYTVAPLDGATSPAVQGSITYEGITYSLETTGSNKISLYYEGDNLHVALTNVSAFNPDNQEQTAVFSGEWSGVIDYTETIRFNFASATNELLNTPAFGVTLTGQTENTSVEFDMFNPTFFQPYKKPILTSYFSEHYPYIPSSSSVIAAGKLYYTQDVRINYGGKSYEVAYCDDSDLTFANPDTWIKVIVTDESTTIDFKLKSKDGCYIFLGTWTGPLDHTGTKPEENTVNPMATQTVGAGPEIDGGK